MGRQDALVPLHLRVRFARPLGVDRFAALLDPSIPFPFGIGAMSAAELAAFGLGIANIVLLIRRNVWNYPFGIAMVAIYFFVFRDAKLYSDALLQIFFLVVQLYGWWHWTRARAETGEIRVEVLQPATRLLLAVSSLVLIAGWGWLMATMTDASFPWLDASVAILSVFAQVLLARRYLENWVVWILVDLISIGLYAAKGLWLTLLLYVIFLALATLGLVRWRQALHGRRLVPA